MLKEVSQLKIMEMREIAQMMEGKCLSKEYNNASSPLDWQCKRGHRWEMPYSLIMQGGWCVQCAKTDERSKIRLEELQEIAQVKGGKCLSLSYKNLHSMFRWQCSEGHVWEATPFQIKHSGTWCKACSGYGKRYTISDMIRLAESREGKCLSLEYVDTATHLKWQCNKGHIWKAVPGAILSGQWCRVCSTMRNADKLRSHISEFIQLAQSRGGKLLSEKYINNRTHMKWECNEGHIWMACGSMVKSGTWCPVCSIKINADKKKSSIEEFIALANERGGKLLSEKYINGYTHLKWQCEKGHTWMAVPDNVKAGSWCPACGLQSRSEKRKNPLSMFIELAKSRGGKLLSDNYINGYTHLKWQCEKGHTWMAVPHSVKDGGCWCPECAGKRLSTDDMRMIAKNRGGKLLSENYMGILTPLQWQCAKGHVWSAKPNSVKNIKTWCPYCAGKRKLETAKTT